MRFKLIIFFFLLNCFAFASGPADYNISVVLKPESKILEGKQTLIWTNTTSYPTSELQFHAYLNAFKDLNSTFMLGSGGRLRNDHFDTSNQINFGYININKILLNGKTDLTKRQSYIQPDNLNKNDQTVIKISLPRSIQPGEMIEISMEFTSKLPKVFARTGWAANDYFLVGQWFPKIGVFEADGTWNCHQFHANTEFYANFGTYHIDITIPKRFKVAATGVKTSETNLKNDLKQITYKAERVHDFAWAASPHFKEYKDKHRNIELTIMMQPEQSYQHRRYIGTLKAAIDYMHEHVGSYPHPTLTLIDPSLDGSGSGGMEYPTFITAGGGWGVGKWFKYQELVTIHEFIHQYFQGMLASNEFEHSWMDEGFTQYFEDRVLKSIYPGGSVIGLTSYPLSSLFSSRISYVTMRNPSIAPIMMNAWQYPGGSYSIMTYTKPAVALHTLENILGQDLMDKVIKTYFNRFQFKHPVPEDFFQTANEVVAASGKFKDLNWFFDAVFREAGTCDYTVEELQNKNGKGSAQLKNLGEVRIPVKVEITFANGKTHIINWDGYDRLMSFPDEIKSIYIDPERHNLLDLNLSNNSITFKEQKKSGLKLLFSLVFWVQNLLV